MTDYYDYVIAVYKHKMAEGSISRRLVDISPANLRDACLELYKKGVSKKDERAIVDVFGPAGEANGHFNLIKKYDLDKYRPLIRYVKEETSDTNLINIELLAWLTDVPGRPYNFKTDYSQVRAAFEDNLKALASSAPGQTPVTTKNHAVKPNTDISVKPLGHLPLTQPIKEATKKAGFVAVFKRLSNGRKIAVSLLAAGLLCGCSYGIYQLIVIINRRSSCMYWARDHYEPVACNQKIEGAFIIAYDSTRAHDFKKITTPDTITYNSIGHVWYSKMENTVEFYTAAGNHPVQIHYQLHPVSAYMIDTYAKQVESKH